MSKIVTLDLSQTQMLTFKVGRKESWKKNFKIRGKWLNMPTTNLPNFISNMKDFLKDEENPRLPNFPKDDKNFDEGYWHQNFDESYGRASGVPFWVDTWQDFEDNFVKKIKNWHF